MLRCGLYVPTPQSWQGPSPWLALKVPFLQASQAAVPWLRVKPALHVQLLRCVLVLGEKELPGQEVQSLGPLFWMLSLYVPAPHALQVSQEPVKVKLALHMQFHWKVEAAGHCMCAPHAIQKLSLDAVL